MRTRELSAAGWRDFWEWTAQTFLEGLQAEAGRGRLTVAAASITRAGARADGEKVTEEVAFSLRVSLAAGASPETRTYLYAREVAGPNRAGSYRVERLT